MDESFVAKNGIVFSFGPDPIDRRSLEADGWPRTESLDRFIAITKGIEEATGKQGFDLFFCAMFPTFNPQNLTGDVRFQVESVLLSRELSSTDDKPGSPVDHPSHYGGADNPYEAIKVIEAWRLGFCLGNAVKYIARNGKKTGSDAVEDLKKARWYLDREIASMEK